MKLYGLKSTNIETGIIKLAATETEIDSGSGYGCSCSIYKSISFEKEECIQRYSSLYTLFLTPNKEELIAKNISELCKEANESITWNSEFNLIEIYEVDINYQ